MDTLGDKAEVTAHTVAPSGVGAKKHPLNARALALCGIHPREAPEYTLTPPATPSERSLWVSRGTKKLIYRAYGEARCHAYRSRSPFLPQTRTAASGVSGAGCVVRLPSETKLPLERRLALPVILASQQPLALETRLLPDTQRTGESKPAAISSAQRWASPEEAHWKFVKDTRDYTRLLSINGR